jgi:eukaryotic-like serine/threonine-protein kinase
LASQPLRPGDPGHLGDYQLEGRLGAGGMGTVFLGRSPQGRPVAIKVVRTEFLRDEEFVGRFRSEVSRARQVPPFCTAEVLDADLDHEPPYLVVEYVDGPTLTDVVRTNGPLSPAALHSAAVGIATALTAIHGAGVIHRDLKPANVLFTLGGLKVIDFGIARPLEVTSQHTRTDQMVGTVAYMAPERFDDQAARRTGPPADIFAWGAVVAFAATGRTPFQGESAPATAMRILTQPPDLTGVPAPLAGIVARALAKDPADRPSARELLDLLLAGGQPAAVPDDQPVAVPRDLAAPRRRRRLPVVLAGLVVAGVLAGGGLVLLQNATSAPEGKAAAPSVPAASPGTPAPKPKLTGSADILAGTRRTLIHMVEIDRDLALPFPDELKASDGTGQDALFALVPTGVDHMIQSVQPTTGEPPCLGVKILPDADAKLVATECAPTKATLFSISATGRKDEKGRPTYLIYNDAHGFIQWWEDKKEIYVQHTGDGEPGTTFSFVDRGPV